MGIFGDFMTGEANALRKKINELNKENDTIKKAMHSLRLQNVEYEKRIMKLKLKVYPPKATLESDIEELNSQLDKAKKTSLEYMEKNTKLDLENEALIKKLDEALIKIDKYEGSDD